jgi:flagellar L-ring protein precursor FlgH
MGFTRALVILLDLMFAAGIPSALAKTKFKDPAQSRADYIARLQDQSAPQAKTTPGSLWVSGGALTDMTTDYKARNVGDTVEILVTLQTTAQSQGDLNQQRSFQTNSAITGLPGKLNTAGLNPLFGAQSATQVQGKGESSNSSNLTTTLAARVIAVLSNHDLVVEAQREVFMNNQHETMFVRGVLRPGDIGPNDTAASASLANLEIELKGKGVISDAIKPTNPIMRALLWLFNF